MAQIKAGKTGLQLQDQLHLTQQNNKVDISSVLAHMRNEASSKLGDNGQDTVSIEKCLTNINQSLLIPPIKRCLLGPPPVDAPSSNNLNAGIRTSRTLLSTPQIFSITSDIKTENAPLINTSEQLLMPVMQVVKPPPVVPESISAVLPSPSAVSELAKQKEYLNQGPLAMQRLCQPPPLPPSRKAGWAPLLPTPGVSDQCDPILSLQTTIEAFNSKRTLLNTPFVENAGSSFNNSNADSMTITSLATSTDNNKMQIPGQVSISSSLNASAAQIVNPTIVASTNIQLPDFTQPPPNFNQPSTFSQMPFSFTHPPPNFNQPPPNFNQKIDYSQPPPNFKQLLPDFSQPPPNFCQPPAAQLNAIENDFNVNTVGALPLPGSLQQHCLKRTLLSTPSVENVPTSVNALVNASVNAAINASVNSSVDSQRRTLLSVPGNSESNVENTEISGNEHYLHELHEWQQQIEDYELQMVEYFKKCAKKLEEHFGNSADSDAPEVLASHHTEYERLYTEYQNYLQYMDQVHTYYKQTEQELQLSRGIAETGPYGPAPLPGSAAAQAEVAAAVAAAAPPGAQTPFVATSASEQVSGFGVTTASIPLQDRYSIPSVKGSTNQDLLNMTQFNTLSPQPVPPPSDNHQQYYQTPFAAKIKISPLNATVNSVAIAPSPPTPPPIGQQPILPVSEETLDPKANSKQHQSSSEMQAMMPNIDWSDPSAVQQFAASMQNNSASENYQDYFTQMINYYQSLLSRLNTTGVVATDYQTTPPQTAAACSTEPGFNLDAQRREDRKRLKQKAADAAAAAASAAAEAAAAAESSSSGEDLAGSDEEEGAGDDESQQLSRNQRRKLKKRQNAIRKAREAKRQEKLARKKALETGSHGVAEQVAIDPSVPVPTFDPSRPPPGYRDPSTDPQSFMGEYFERQGQTEWNWPSWHNYISSLARNNPEWYRAFMTNSQSMGIDWDEMYRNWVATRDPAQLYNMGIDVTSMALAPMPAFDGSFANQPLQMWMSGQAVANPVPAAAETLFDKESVAATRDNSDSSSEDSDDDWSFCQLCNQEFGTERSYTAHLRGMKHMQNALTQANEAKPHILKDEVKRQNEASASDLSAEKKHQAWVVTQFSGVKRRGLGLSGSFYCELCSVECTSEKALHMHLNGVKHTKRLEVMKTGAAAAADSKVEEVAATAIGGGSKTKPRATLRVQCLLDNCLEALIGLQYITEYQKANVLAECKYLCSLCDSRYGKDEFVSHLVSFKHRKNYLKYNIPDLFEILDNDYSVKTVKIKRMEIYARKIEDLEGRKRPSIKVEITDPEQLKEKRKAVEIDGSAKTVVSRPKKTNSKKKPRKPKIECLVDNVNANEELEEGEIPEDGEIMEGSDLDSESGGDGSASCDEGKASNKEEHEEDDEADVEYEDGYTAERRPLTFELHEDPEREVFIRQQKENKLFRVRELSDDTLAAFLHEAEWAMARHRQTNEERKKNEDREREAIRRKEAASESARALAEREERKLARRQLRAEVKAAAAKNLTPSAATNLQITAAQQMTGGLMLPSMPLGTEIGPCRPGAAFGSESSTAAAAAAITTTFLPIGPQALPPSLQQQAEEQAKAQASLNSLAETIRNVTGLGVIPPAPGSVPPQSSTQLQQMQDMLSKMQQMMQQMREKQQCEAQELSERHSLISQMPPTATTNVDLNSALPCHVDKSNAAAQKVLEDGTTASSKVTLGLLDDTNDSSRQRQRHYRGNTPLLDEPDHDSSVVSHGHRLGLFEPSVYDEEASLDHRMRQFADEEHLGLPPGKDKDRRGKERHERSRHQQRHRHASQEHRDMKKAMQRAAEKERAKREQLSSSGGAKSVMSVIGGLSVPGKGVLPAPEELMLRAQRREQKKDEKRRAKREEKERRREEKEQRKKNRLLQRTTKELERQRHIQETLTKQLMHEKSSRLDDHKDLILVENDDDDDDDDDDIVLLGDENSHSQLDSFSLTRGKSSLGLLDSNNAPFSVFSKAGVKRTLLSTPSISNSGDNFAIGPPAAKRTLLTTPFVPTKKHVGNDNSNHDLIQSSDELLDIKLKSNKSLLTPSNVTAFGDGVVRKSGTTISANSNANKALLPLPTSVSANNMFNAYETAVDDSIVRVDLTGSDSTRRGRDEWRFSNLRDKGDSNADDIAAIRALQDSDSDDELDPAQLIRQVASGPITQRVASDTKSQLNAISKLLGIASNDSQDLQPTASQWVNKQQPYKMHAPAVPSNMNQRWPREYQQESGIPVAQLTASAMGGGLWASASQQNVTSTPWPQLQLKPELPHYYAYGQAGQASFPPQQQTTVNAVLPVPNSMTSSASTQQFGSFSQTTWN